MTAVANRFYVYGLFDRGVPFYVGKGHGKRARNHIGEARRGSHLPVHKKIRSMQKEPTIKILTGELSEDEAYELEELAIMTVGRRADSAGPLLNLSSGGRGGTSGHIVILTPEQVARRNAAVRSPEVRKKISDAQRGKKKNLTPEGLAAIRATHKGKVLSAETRAKISAATKGKCRYIPNAEQRAAISKRLRGRPVSDETKRRISESVKQHGGLTEEQQSLQREKVLKVVTCPHCAKSGARSIMLRWHFDNCKHK